MACGCGKKTTFPQNAPLTLGEANGVPAAQFRTTISLNGMRPGATFWATGSGVHAMAVNKWIVAVD